MFKISHYQSDIIFLYANVSITILPPPRLTFFNIKMLNKKRGAYFYAPLFSYFLTYIIASTM